MLTKIIISDCIIHYSNKNKDQIVVFNFSIDLSILSNKNIIGHKIFDILDLKNIDYKFVKVELNNYTIKQKDKQLQGRITKFNSEKENLKKDIDSFLDTCFSPFLKE